MADGRHTNSLSFQWSVATVNDGRRSEPLCQILQVSQMFTSGPDQQVASTSQLLRVRLHLNNTFHRSMHRDVPTVGHGRTFSLDRRIYVDKGDESGSMCEPLVGPTFDVSDNESAWHRKTLSPGQVKMECTICQVVLSFDSWRAARDLLRWRISVGIKSSFSCPEIQTLREKAATICKFAHSAFVTYRGIKFIIELNLNVTPD